LVAAAVGSKYRTTGVPEGIDMMAYGPDSHPEVVDSFREGFVWDAFYRSEPACAEQIAACPHCVLIRGTPADDSTLNYLRDVAGMMTFMLDHGGCGVYDPFGLRYWNPVDWKQKIFEPARPVPERHVVILTSPEDDPTRTWFHTRGLRKFGRPVISVPGVKRELHEAVIDLCNRFIEHQALGLVVEDGRKIRTALLPEGGVARHAGHLDDPDFNNVHLIIRWPES
jgi:hypothetical protein